jgi:ATP-dependent protease ClpP protease subunit
MKQISLSGIVGIDIQPEQVNQQLNEAGGDEIDVDLSSIGGYLAPALQIYNAIKKYSGKKSVLINGYVASASAYIASAFDVVKAMPNSIFMIHNAISGTYGDYRVMEKEAVNLKALNNVLADAYNKKSGKSTGELLNLMNAESYFYGSEIMDAGFADEMTGIEDKKSNKADRIAEVKAMFSGLNLTNSMQDMRSAVEYLNSASEREIEERDFNEVKKLISTGAINKSEKLELSSADKPIFLGTEKGQPAFACGKNGIVYVTAIRNLATKAGQLRFSKLSSVAGELMKLVENKSAVSGKQQLPGGKKLEILNTLKTMKENGEISLIQIAEALDLKSQLMTPEAEKSLAVINKLTDMGISDPIATITAMQACEKADEAAVRNAKLDKRFGPEKINDKVNFLRTYAGKEMASVDSKELDAKIEEMIKTDLIVQKFASENADIMSQINVIDNSGSAKPTGIGRRVEIV